jgi:MoxR-like ATPase
MVLATQNPIENEGTYPLPEAQLDRFLFKIQVDFPTFAELKKIMDITVTNKETVLNPVLSGDDIMNIRQYVNEIPMAEEVEAFALRLVIGTHPEVPGANELAKKYISVGASPRAAQAIFKTARAKAMLEGRYNVSFADVESVALPALRHRVTLSFEALAEGITTDQIVKKIVSSIPKE